MDPSYPKVIRLDSRYRSSGGPTDPVFNLPSNPEFPDGTHCYVSAFSCPHAWYNVDTGLSDKLYVRETRTQGGVALVRCRVLQLEAGNYTSMTLPPALQTLLNTGKSFAASYEVSYVPSQGCLRIQLNTAADLSALFQLPSEDELTSQAWRTANWTGTADAFSADDLDTMGDLLRLPETSAPTTNVLTGLLNTSPVDVLYLRSPSLATYNSIGPRGEADILQRVPVTTSYGYNLSWTSSGSDAEYSLVRGSFSQLRFSLTNVRGRVVSLHGGFFSVELTFV
jgi:hypothetical protein